MTVGWSMFSAGLVVRSTEDFNVWHKYYLWKHRESVLNSSVSVGLVEKWGKSAMVLSCEPVKFPVHIRESNWKSLMVFGTEQ